MSQTAITLAFEQHLADVQMGSQPVIPDEFVLANIPDLDLATPIDRAAGLPSAGQIVHRQLVDQRGKVNANGVAYSIIMDTRIGDFTFNAMYLLHKASGLVAMVVHKESEDKLRNQGVIQPGNSLVKSMIMEYQGAAVATNTTVDASTWQIDFSARLFGLDRDIQQQTHDHYGDAAFMGDGLLVRAGTGVNEFIVTAGLGYVAGLRSELKQRHSMVVASRPATVYADVYHAGTLLSDWDTVLTITASTAPLVDYIDQSGYQHYVTPLAQLAANGAITDLRGRGGLWWHEQRPQAHTKDQVGLDKLENWGWSHSYTDATGGAGKYATGKAVADGYNALNSAKLNAASYTAADVLAKMLTVHGADSKLDADLLDGQHGDYYRAWGSLTGVPTTFEPAAHTHPWAQISGAPVQATRWPAWTEVTSKPTTFEPAAHTHPWVQISGAPVQATRWPTPTEIGLGSVSNYPITASVADASDAKYATAGAVKKAYDRASSAINSAANNKVYAGSLKTETNFPIGHLVVAWMSVNVWQAMNSQHTLYVNTYPDYGGAMLNYVSDGFPNYRGAALAGSWACRGFTGEITNTKAMMYQRVA